MVAAKNFQQVLCQSFPPKPTFSADQIPDLTGRVVIVTGGYVGIGKETTKALLNHNAKVYIASRSREKANAAIQELTEITGREPLFLPLDLGNLRSVRQAAEEFLSKEQQLHILFNNAGVMVPPIEQLTADGYDLQFGTNTLGHWYFTKLLMPALLRGKETSPDHHARIIHTSSGVAYLHTLSFDTFRDSPARKALGPPTLYAQSKFGNAIVSKELARRYADQGIISIALNPGNIQTELQRHIPNYQRVILNKTLLAPQPMGALTQLYAGTMPDALNYNGEFLIPFARLGKLRKEVDDPELAAKLWDWLEEQVEQL
ncbi:NAD-P-binding protein [Trametopsis cervina]|nr:NAD-P-binding protein [Trametopsis cervina]